MGMYMTKRAGLKSKIDSEFEGKVVYIYDLDSLLFNAEKHERVEFFYHLNKIVELGSHRFIFVTKLPEYQAGILLKRIMNRISPKVVGDVLPHINVFGKDYLELQTGKIYNPKVVKHELTARIILELKDKNAVVRNYYGDEELKIRKRYNLPIVPYAVHTKTIGDLARHKLH